MHTRSSAHGDAQEPGRDPAEVCTLPPRDLGDRLAWIRQEILPHALATVRLERGLAFELAGAPGLADKLDRLVALERACCSSLAFERPESATPGRLRLEIRGVDPDAAIFASLAVSGAQPRQGTPRVLKAAGFGVLASLFVCCVLPVAAVALLGAGAASLAPLDGPGPIAVGALVAGAGAWWWLGRRRGPASPSKR